MGTFRKTGSVGKQCSVAFERAADTEVKELAAFQVLVIVSYRTEQVLLMSLKVPFNTTITL